jgi:hypothetical protein
MGKKDILIRRKEREKEKKITNHVKEVGTRFDNISPDSLDDLCWRSSRLCWMQNLILNRMMMFSEGVIG